MGVYSCTLPADWDGEWHDSSDTTQDITITRSNNYVVGWGVIVYISPITSWTCVDGDTTNNLLLFKSNQTADVFGAPHDIYRCIKWEKLTEYSYSYLIYAIIDSSAQNKRVLILATYTVADTSSGCNPSNGIPSAIETVVLVKKAGGVAYCAYSISVGSNYYVTVVNADSTVDFSHSFRFTCYAVKSFGGLVYASDNKGMCLPNQDPQTKSATGTGTLTFSAFSM
uniref:Uncharacterized protein n=1 Tax=Magallana gigas TaxID=29159 RepID=A0A8W8L8W6_MAGGI